MTSKAWVPGGVAAEGAGAVFVLLQPVSGMAPARSRSSISAETKMPPQRRRRRNPRGKHRKRKDARAGPLLARRRKKYPRAEVIVVPVVAMVRTAWPFPVIAAGLKAQVV